MAAFHIYKACPSAYKVFFFGASGSYIGLNNSGHELVCGL
jgi:hypothetical protein